MAKSMKVLLRAFEAELGRAGLKRSRGAKSAGAGATKDGEHLAALAALWAWSNGARDPIFFDPKSDSLDDDEGLRFLTVQQSHALARDLAGLVPLATDGAGNCVCVEAKSGRVVDWDHETKKTRKLATSLEAYLEAATRALKKRSALGISARAKAPADLKSKIVSKLYDFGLDQKDPKTRKKTIAVMNDPRAMGTDKHDDDWVLDRLIDILVQARNFAPLRYAAPFADRVLRIAKKRGVEADVRRTLGVSALRRQAG